MTISNPITPNTLMHHTPKFLIIRFSSIGDIIQCLGIIDGIRKHFPEAEIHWITRKDMSSFLAMDKRISKIWAFDKNSGLKGLWEMAGQLKKEKYDYVYDAHSNIRSNILKLKLRSFFQSKPHFALRSKQRWKRLLLFKFHINRFKWPFRGMESYREPLKKWGIRDFSGQNQDWTFPPDFPDQLNSFIDKNTVTLVPSANWPMKRWPVGHWKKLITLLPDYRFIILGGPSDTFCENLRAVAPERVINLAGQTSLFQSCYLIHQSHVVISADTGLMHAADLFRIPAIALIGPTAFGFPSGPTVDIFEVDLPCRPCTKDGRGKCKQTIYQKCMTDIMPLKVAQWIKKKHPIQHHRPAF